MCWFEASIIVRFVPRAQRDNSLGSALKVMTAITVASGVDGHRTGGRVISLFERPHAVLSSDGFPSR